MALHASGFGRGYDEAESCADGAVPFEQRDGDGRGSWVHFFDGRREPERARAIKLDFELVTIDVRTRCPCFEGPVEYRVPNPGFVVRKDDLPDSRGMER